MILHFCRNFIALNLTFIFHSVADSFSGCYCESSVPTLAKAVKYQKTVVKNQKYFRLSGNISSPERSVSEFAKSEQQEMFFSLFAIFPMIEKFIDSTTQTRLTLNRNGINFGQQKLKWN